MDKTRKIYFSGCPAEKTFTILWKDGLKCRFAQEGVYDEPADLVDFLLSTCPHIFGTSLKQIYAFRGEEYPPKSKEKAVPNNSKGIPAGDAVAELKRMNDFEAIEKWTEGDDRPQVLACIEQRRQELKVDEDDKKPEPEPEVKADKEPEPEPEEKDLKKMNKAELLAYAKAHGVEDMNDGMTNKKIMEAIEGKVDPGGKE